MYLPSLRDLAIGSTGLVRLNSLCPSGQLFLKLESSNPTGSLKDRTAYYLVEDAIRRANSNDFAIVESTSGNLGLGLQYVAGQLGIKVHAIVDPTIPKSKKVRMENAGITVSVVDQNEYPDFRTARIARARMMESTGQFLWTNQYANEAGLLAHFETTGPEIWRQTGGSVDAVVCSVGTGGTICGIGRALKEKNPEVEIYAVEPEGSTIFGGYSGKYITAGAGLLGPSELVLRHGSIIDYFSHVSDGAAMSRCRQCVKSEGLSVGITAGAALEVGLHLARSNQDSVVVVIAPDSGVNYVEYIDSEAGEVVEACVRILPFQS